MSKKPPPKPSQPLICSHVDLILTPSSNCHEAGYKQPSLEQRIAATTPTGSVKAKIDSKSKREAESLGTFPAPLILPDDDLALDPTYPPQSLRAWIREKDRNKVTDERRTVYLAAPPKIQVGLEFMNDWGRARHTSGGKGKKKGNGAAEIVRPDSVDVQGYLEVFYHGLPVKLLPNDVFNFTPEIDDFDTVPTSNLPNRRIVGLSTQTESGNKGIRSRPTPDGLFSHQLNLDDLLDAAIWALPDDAYALLLLVEQDLFEDEDDEFVCGRAYGGSRVAVISTARYDPSLDECQDVGREHAWPASHCAEYVKSLVGGTGSGGRRKGAGAARSKDEEKIVIVIDDSSDEEALPTEQAPISPMQRAISVHSSLPIPSSLSQKHLTGLWLSRICRTAAHELGHCFGMDHCVYYACSMQGSASIVEDARQPPYLCPVDLAKLLKATGGEERERYESIREWCESEGRGELGFFGSYGAWIAGRLAGM